MLPFREYHLIALLEEYDKQHLPLDLFISHYFRERKALGSKDRGFIAENIYAMVRWRGLLDFLCEAPCTWEKRYTLFSTLVIGDYLTREDIPLHTRLSFPQHLFDLIKVSHGEARASELCVISNKAAPTAVRANALVTTREELFKMWEKKYDISLCVHSPLGIIFNKKINFFSLPEFQKGFFEVQDEGSQLLAQLIDVKPGQKVLDYCAGSGGKTLAFAPRMQNTGQIYLHDVRTHALQESRRRLKRSKIQNAQIVLADDLAKLKKLKKNMQWVLVDAPCTGTGTMRRNPDMKWNMSEETLPRLLGLQRSIFEKALSFMHPEGCIVYATCSILNEENQDQIAHFIKTYDLELAQEPFQSFPSEGGMDGFFGAILKRKQKP